MPAKAITGAGQRCGLFSSLSLVSLVVPVRALGLVSPFLPVSSSGLVSSFSLVGLVCGVFASLALGVLIAHAICVSMFALFRIHARSVAEARLATARAAQLGQQAS